jgi:hypothetical protein
MTEKGKKYFSKKLKTLLKEGYSKKQALAIDYSMLRKKGYKAKR